MTKKQEVIFITTDDAIRVEDVSKQYWVFLYKQDDRVPVSDHRDNLLTEYTLLMMDVFSLTVLVSCVFAVSTGHDALPKDLPQRKKIVFVIVLSFHIFSIFSSNKSSALAIELIK